MRKLLLSLLIIISTFTNTVTSAQTSSDWKPNTAVVSASYTIAGTETITAGFCITPIFHFTNVFPTAAGGKIVHYNFYYGPAPGQGGNAYLILDKAPSATLINSCIENGQPIFTMADELSIIGQSPSSNCQTIVASGSFGCSVASLELLGVESASTDLWAAAISNSGFQVTSGWKSGFRIDSRY